MIKEMDFTYKKGGTTLYFREERNALVCVDIDIEPGSKIAYFCFNKKFNVQLRTTLKQFPWVTNLYIDKTVLDMYISNHMFPNVKKILGSSKQYSMGQNVLIKKEPGILYNAFCKKPGELIDLTGVKYIANNAFDGCMSNNVLHPDIKTLYSVSKDTFNNFAGKLIDKNGIYYIGDLFYGINYCANVIDMPHSNHLPARFHLSENIVNKIIVHDYHPSLAKLNAKTICIADDFCDSFIDLEATCENFEVDYNNKYFASIEGIVYSKDKSILVQCPGRKTGTVIIPEGTNIIANGAFSGTSIEKIVLPESVDVIKARAFWGSKISDIEFHNNSIYIKDEAFAYCQNLSKIVLPEKIKYLGNGAFKNCKNLKQISIPSSIRLASDALINFDEITIEGDEIPENFIHAVSTNMAASYGSCTVIHFNNGKSMCIPKYMSKYNIETISAKISGTVSEINEHDMFHLFVYSKAGMDKYLTALLTYIVNGDSDEFTKKYLRKSCSKFIDIFAKSDKEEMFVYFIKMGFLTKKTKEKAIALAQRKNWTIALAYLLDSTNCNTNASFKL